MNTKTNINEPTIEQRVERIAQNQQKIAEILEAAQKQVSSLEIECSQHADALLHATRNSKKNATATYEAMKKHRVCPGDLNSRLVDAIESKTSRRLYPAPYEEIAQRWAIVSRGSY